MGAENAGNSREGDGSTHSRTRRGGEGKGAGGGGTRRLSGVGLSRLESMADATVLGLLQGGAVSKGGGGGDAGRRRGEEIKMRGATWQVSSPRPAGFKPSGAGHSVFQIRIHSKQVCKIPLTHTKRKSQAESVACCAEAPWQFLKTSRLMVP